jgi:hypothetical protein
MSFDLTTIVRILLAVAAVYRVAMFAREEGAFGVFANTRALLGRWASRSQHGGIAWTLAELSNCPHCAGVWLALLVFPAILWPSIYSDAVILILAIAGLQSYLTHKQEGE